MGEALGLSGRGAEELTGFSAQGVVRTTPRVQRMSVGSSEGGVDGGRN